MTEKQTDLRLIEGGGEGVEIEKTERVLKVVRGIDWGYLHSLPSIQDNPFYKELPPDDAA